MASFQEIVSTQLCKIVKSLASIDTTLKPAGTLRGKKNGWTYIQVNKSWFFTTEITYAGVAYTLDLNFSDVITADAIQIVKIEQIWNDATSKDLSMRMYTDPNKSYYAELYAETGNTDTSVITQFGSEYNFSTVSRLRLFYNTNTSGKTAQINVQVNEI